MITEPAPGGVVTNGPGGPTSILTITMTIAEFARVVGELSREIGWERCAEALLPAGRAVAPDLAAMWKQPRHAQLEELRQPDHERCRAVCRGCSRCVHAEAYEARGGRPYLGAEAECELAWLAVELACMDLRVGAR